MSKKTTTTNGLAQDLIKSVNGITLKDKTHASQIQWFMSNQITFIQNNITSKKAKIEELDQQQHEAVKAHDEKREELDHGAVLQRDRDIQWNRDQIEVAESFLTYLQEASQQLFPNVHNRSEQNAKALESIISRYRA